MAVIVFVLVVKLKHRYQLPQEANEIFQILGLTVFEKTPIFELFSEIKQRSGEVENHKQLSLFDL